MGMYEMNTSFNFAFAGDRSINTLLKTPLKFTQHYVFCILLRFFVGEGQLLLPFSVTGGKSGLGDQHFIRTYND